MKKLLKESFGFMQNVATKKVIKQFTDKYDFVYFGHVDQREDEHQLVRGLTAAAEHTDNNYAVGNFRGHDVIIVERQNTLAYPGKGKQQYRWLIMQIDLKLDGIPHVFMDAHHHEEIFYANLFLKFAHFENATNIFVRHDPLFYRNFKVFAEPDTYDEVWSTFKPELTSMLGHHFRQFDYEFDDDRLYIYASNAVITLHILQEMMRVGMWLADQLNAPDTQTPRIDA